jgi:hypothetical protein
MTTVVWDGRRLATDRQVHSNGVRESITKIVTLEKYAGGRDVIGACFGDLVSGLALVDWYKSGADPKQWPQQPAEANDRACLVVVNPRVSPLVKVYFREPFPQVIEDPFMAWGSGREFALGALAMGADAKRAVEVACEFDIYSGRGVDVVECL